MSHPNIPEPDMNWPIIRAVVVVGIVLYLVSSGLSSVHHPVLTTLVTKPSGRA